MQRLAAVFVFAFVFYFGYVIILAWLSKGSKNFAQPGDRLRTGADMG